MAQYDVAIILVNIFLCNFYLLEIIFLYCLPGGNCHNVIVALVTLCDVAMHLDHLSFLQMVSLS